MKNFYISRDALLTQDKILQFIANFNTANRGVMQRRWNYWDGRQAILQRPVTEEKPSNRVVTNFVKTIVDNYTGYATGIPVKYKELDDKILEILDYNDESEQDSLLFRDGLIFGRGIEVAYIDSESKTRFKPLDPRTIIPVYSDDLEEELLFAIRFWTLDQDNYVTVYDSKYITEYKSVPGFTSIEFVRQYQHYFNQVPVTVFSINKEEKALAEDIFSLQDAYNSLMSDNLDNEDAFADAYLVLKGVIADENDLASMRKNRVLMLDNDSEAQYLTKDVNQSNNVVLLDKVEQKIRQISNCPDFSDTEKFNAQSGIAIRYKLLGMENSASKIVNRFETSLRKRIELIAYVESLKSDSEWSDVEIVMERNIPLDLSTNAQAANSLRGLVSTETLLSMIPIVDDPVEEAKKVKEEQKLELYSFEGDNYGNSEER